MGNWYRVTKNINGRLYDYWQRTYRIGKSVKTENIYIGPSGRIFATSDEKEQYELMKKNNYVFIAADREREARRVASLFANNDKVLITDRATGKSQTRFIYNSPNNGLLVTDAASGIPRKLDLDKFDIKLIEKNSPDAPKRGPSINSPEMIDLEKNNKEWMPGDKS